MGRSFQIVEYKVSETEFFLIKIEESTYGFKMFDARNLLSAFLSSSRSITFCIQASLCHLPGFTDWYDNQQEQLRKNKLARYFLEARNQSQKVGYYPLTSALPFVDAQNNRRVEYHFDRTTEGLTKFVPEEDVLTACRKYFTLLLTVVYECYQTFGTIIDPERYFSIENMHNLGMTIEDFEADLDFPRGWTNLDGCSDSERMEILRDRVRDELVDPILLKYLGKNRFGNPG